MNVNKINDEDVSNSTNIKEYIHRYVLMKIVSGDWKPGQKIPSENILTAKFGCSRMTTRNALQNFIYTGVLESIKGYGYVVSKSIEGTIFSSVGNKYKKTHSTTNEFLNPEKIIKHNWLNDLGITEFDFKQVRNFEKIYFRDSLEIVHQFSLVNKNEIFKLDIEEINNSFTHFITYQGIVISSLTESIVYDDSLHYLNEIAKSLEWNGDYPIDVSVLKTSNSWVEISVKIIRKSEFHFVKTSKFMY